MNPDFQVLLEKSEIILLSPYMLRYIPLQRKFIILQLTGKQITCDVDDVNVRDVFWC